MLFISLISGLTLQLIGVYEYTYVQINEMQIFCKASFMIIVVSISFAGNITVKAAAEDLTEINNKSVYLQHDVDVILIMKDAQERVDVNLPVSPVVAA